MLVGVLVLMEMPPPPLVLMPPPAQIEQAAHRVSCSRVSKRGAAVAALQLRLRRRSPATACSPPIASLASSGATELPGSTSEPSAAAGSAMPSENCLTDLAGAAVAAVALASAAVSLKAEVSAEAVLERAASCCWLVVLLHARRAVSVISGRRHRARGGRGSVHGAHCCSRRAALAPGLLTASSTRVASTTVTAAARSILVAVGRKRCWGMGVVGLSRR
jgi:hypothetical protein